MFYIWKCNNLFVFFLSKVQLRLKLKVSKFDNAIIAIVTTKSNNRLIMVYLFKDHFCCDCYQVLIFIYMFIKNSLHILFLFHILKNCCYSFNIADWKKNIIWNFFKLFSMLSHLFKCWALLLIDIFIYLILVFYSFKFDNYV